MAVVTEASPGTGATSTRRPATTTRRLATAITDPIEAAVASEIAGLARPRALTAAPRGEHRP